MEAGIAILGPMRTPPRPPPRPCPGSGGRDRRTPRHRRQAEARRVLLARRSASGRKRSVSTPPMEPSPNNSPSSATKHPSVLQDPKLTGAIDQADRRATCDDTIHSDQQLAHGTRSRYPDLTGEQVYTDRDPGQSGCDHTQQPCLRVDRMNRPVLAAPHHHYESDQCDHIGERSNGTDETVGLEIDRLG